MAFSNPDQYKTYCELFYKSAYGQITQVPLASFNAHATICGDVAVTEVSQEFRNQQDKSIKKLVYQMPLFAGAVITAFEATVGGETLHGQVQSNEAAKAEFNAASGAGLSSGIVHEIKDADVFSTTLSNIPAKSSIKVKVTYMNIMTQDFGIVGYRYTLPTIIAPKHGQSSNELVLTEHDSLFNKARINITVDIEGQGGSYINKVICSTTKAVVNMGKLSSDKPNVRSHSKAHVTLQEKIQLGDDFVLRIQTEPNTPEQEDLTKTQPNLSSAVLETFKHNSTSQAIKVSFVPGTSKSTDGRAKEIVLLCDLSNSMDDYDAIGKLKEAARIAVNAIRHLPDTTIFNIVAFGGKYRFLWTKDDFSGDSKKWTEETYEEALTCINGFSARMGATIFAPPLQAIINGRDKTRDLDLLVLTDAEVTNPEIKALSAQVKREVKASENQIRLFTLAIGPLATHELIQQFTLASNGMGLAALESNEIQANVMALLNATQPPRVQNYSVTVKYTDGTEDVVSQGYCVPSNTSSNSMSHSFFPTEFKGKSVNSAVSITDSRYVLKSGFKQPSIIQSPVTIPVLGPQTELTMYLLLQNQGANRQPTEISLTTTTKENTGTVATPVIEEVKSTLTAKITTTPTPGEVIHQLAAKSISRELTDESGWMSQVERLPGQSAEIGTNIFSDEVRRLGLYHGIITKETSIVLIQNLDIDMTGTDDTQVQPASATVESANAIDHDWEVVVQPAVRLASGNDYHNYQMPSWAATTAAARYSGYRSSGTRGAAPSMRSAGPTYTRGGNDFSSTTRGGNEISYGTRGGNDFSYATRGGSSPTDFTIGASRGVSGFRGGPPDDSDSEDSDDQEETAATKTVPTKKERPIMLGTDPLNELILRQDLKHNYWEAAGNGQKAIQTYGDIPSYELISQYMMELVDLEAGETKDRVVATLIVLAIFTKQYPEHRLTWTRAYHAANDWVAAQLSDVVGADNDELVAKAVSYLS